MIQFKNYKATQRFSTIYQGLSQKDQKEFGKQVRKLFDYKVTADDGLEFWITEKDLTTLAKHLNG